MKSLARHRHAQSGAMLLEALIAILIFSLGILAIIGLQAQSIRNSSEAKYRSDASYLANQLIGRMWADRANLATYAHRPGGTTVCSPTGTSAGTTTNVGRWMTSFTPTTASADANKPLLLPGATPNNQQVVIGPVVNNTRTVFIRICWVSPTGQHNYDVQTILNF
ncbi:MAG: type IV pilus modification protein PilV [Betaproteobacteria bacterium]